MNFLFALISQAYSVCVECHYVLQCENQFKMSNLLNDQLLQVETTCGTLLCELQVYLSNFGLFCLWFLFIYSW